MVTKKVELELEFPDCAVCGEGIFEGEEFTYIGVLQEKYTCKNEPSYRIVAPLFGYEILPVHEKCIGSPESINILFEKIKQLHTGKKT